MNAYEIRSNQVINYMKLHITSLEQDVDKLAPFLLDEGVPIEITFVKGQLEATRHLLSVVADILGIQLEEK